MKYLLNTLLTLLSASILFPSFPIPATAATCLATEPDMEGPFYKPNAPIRSSVGKGYVLKGVVRSIDCIPIPGAKIELWLAGPDGKYADAYRATITADSSGAYRFESHVPTPYTGRPPHIHLRVSAKGYNVLITQHYPEAGKINVVMDLVLTTSQ